MSATTPKKKIYVVDDSLQMREMLKDYLESQGYAVDVFTDAAQAIAALQASGGGDVAAVISDFAMPGMNGIELLRWLGATYPRIPGVLITAYGGPELAAESKALQLEYLTKPFKLALLGTALVRGGMRRR